MLNYVRQFFKIKVVLSETKSVSPNFLAFLTQVAHYLTAVRIKKIYQLETFCANVLKCFDWSIGLTDCVHCGCKSDTFASDQRHSIAKHSSTVEGNRDKEAPGSSLNQIAHPHPPAPPPPLPPFKTKLDTKVSSSNLSQTKMASNKKFNHTFTSFT